MGSRYDVQFIEDPSRFLECAGRRLAAEPVVSTVVSTVAERMARSPQVASSAPYSWFAVATDERGEVAGLAMRTALFAPYPPYLLPMGDDVALALADALLDGTRRFAVSTGRCRRSGSSPNASPRARAVRSQ